MSEQADVTIVGYGPAGLVLAAALGAKGHKVAVVERWPTLYGLPRLSHIDDETARIVQATADVDHALRDAFPLSQYHFVNGKGETLLMAGLHNAVGASGFPLDLSIFQPDIDAAIDAYVQKQGSVKRFMAHEAIGLEQDSEGVTLEVRSVETGEVSTIRSSYLVGCDGSRSFVRNAVGVERTDFGFNERWLNIDVLILRPLDERFKETVQYCDPKRGHMRMPIGTKRLRFELALLPGEEEAPFTDPEFAWTWLRERHDLGPDDVAIIRQAVYTFEARLADRWMVDSVLLAGDAAHTMPPYLGQGACSAMRDGLNLSWRLDLVLRGLAPPTVLEGYEEERRPIVTGLTQIAIQIGKIANEHDEERAAMRDAAMRGGKMPPPKLPVMTSGLIDAARTDLSGTVSPQGKVKFRGQEGRFDDVVGRGFVLISRRPVGLSRNVSSMFEKIGGISISLENFEDLDGTYSNFFDDHQIEGIIVRPDFVIFGAGVSQIELTGLLEALITRLSGAVG